MFEQARAVIEPVLEQFGFALAQERYDQGSFGSAMAVYERRGSELRLIWDGREGALFSEHRSGAEQDKRVDWEGPAVTTVEGIDGLTNALKTRFSTK